jgi:hypothetical protein
VSESLIFACGAYLLVAALCAPRLTRWVWPKWHAEFPHSATRREAACIGLALSLLWPSVILLWVASSLLDLIVHRAFKGIAGGKR